jgi:hypothetical protein
LKKLLTKRGIFRYNNQRHMRCGPVVQLVRTLACHARGRRFEPVPGRHKAPIDLGAFDFFVLPTAYS